MPSSLIPVQDLIGRRHFVTISLCFSGILASGCLAKSRETHPKILFICQAGTAKSAIAREIFRQRSMQRGIEVNVFSRGLEIKDHISPQLRQKLLADGINTTAETATPLKPEDWAAADILVNFNPLPASVNHKDVRDWTDVPSVNDDYENARALMIERIDALLNEIAGSQNSR